MDRRQRRNENYVSNISMWVLGAVAVALLIAFGVGIVINNNQTRQAKRFTTNTQRIAETNTMVNTSENMQNNTQAVSISIGRSVNEMQESTTNTEKNNTEKICETPIDYLRHTEQSPGKSILYQIVIEDGKIVLIDKK